MSAIPYVQAWWSGLLYGSFDEDMGVLHESECEMGWLSIVSLGRGKIQEWREGEGIGKSLVHHCCCANGSIPDCDGCMWPSLLDS